MTRLRTEWIENMPSGMENYNNRLKKIAGIDLSGLILDAYDISAEELEAARRKFKVGVVPVTQGEGIIGSFCEAVAAIVRSVGFEAIVAEHTDVDGIYGLKKAGADIIFMADDVRYLALNTLNGEIGENDYSTALGFFYVLKNMMSVRNVRFSDEKILIIGYGKLGKEAARIMKNLSIRFDFFDKASEAVKKIKDDFRGTDIDVLKRADEIKNYRCILDFTNEGGWLKREYLMVDAIYSSPGVPVSLDEEALLALQNDAIYDNLEIGTAMMLAESIFNAKNNK